MKLIARNGVIETDNDYIVGSIIQDREVERTISMGSEAVPIIEKFVEDFYKIGSRTKKSIKPLQDLVDKYKK